MSRSNPFPNPYLAEEQSSRPGSSGTSYSSFQSSPSSLSRSRRASFSLDPSIFQGLPSDVFRNTSSKTDTFDYLDGIPSSRSADFPRSDPLEWSGGPPCTSASIEDNFGMGHERYNSRPSSYGSSFGMASRSSGFDSTASLPTTHFSMPGALPSQHSGPVAEGLTDAVSSSTSLSAHPSRRRKLSRTSPPLEDWPTGDRSAPTSASINQWSLPEMPHLPPVPAFGASSTASIGTSGRPLRSASQKVRQTSAVPGDRLPPINTSMGVQAPSTAKPPARRRRLSMLPPLGSPLPRLEPPHAPAISTSMPTVHRDMSSTSFQSESVSKEPSISASWRLPPADDAAKNYLTNREPTVSVLWGTVPPLHIFPPWARTGIMNGSSAVPLDPARPDPLYMDTESTRRDSGLTSSSRASSRRLGNKQRQGRP